MCVSIGTGVGEGSVPSVGLSIDEGTLIHEELDNVHMALLRGLH